jgi:hypothetical protein
VKPKIWLPTFQLQGTPFIQKINSDEIDSAILISIDILKCNQPSFEEVTISYEFVVDIQTITDTALVQSFHRSLNNFFFTLTVNPINPEDFLPLRTPVSSDIKGMCKVLVNQAINYPGFQGIMGNHPKINPLNVGIMLAKIIHEDEIRQVQV